MIQERPQSPARSLTGCFTSQSQGCLGELQDAAVLFDHRAFVGRPGWVPLQMGARPLPANIVEPREWPHEWQCYASSASEYFRMRSEVVYHACAANQAHLRSHSGPGSSSVLSRGVLQIRSSEWNHNTSALCGLERMRLLQHVAKAKCECFAESDIQGRRQAACRRSGRLRAAAPKRTRARVRRGATCS